MDGKVITFYSYKGGVGRSMAMANVGIILAQWGYKTLIIDWDLEAPGLENFFKDFINIDEAKRKLGLLDLLNIKKTNKNIVVDNINWDDFITKIPVNKNLDFISAGRSGEEYIDKLKSFDFNLFYKEHDGGQYLEELRNSWIDKYRFILIDSRTGLTDSSGVCSIHMPDILVLLFTLNEQSFEGIRNVAKRAVNGQKKIIFDRFRLRVLPIPSRIENAETILMDEWMLRIYSGSEEMLDWLPKVGKDFKDYLITPADLINQIKIPYKTFYAYGEKLAVIGRGTRDPQDLGYVYETISSILATDLQQISLLVDSRDTLIRKAKGEDLTNDSGLHREIVIENTILGEKLLSKEYKLNKNTKLLYIATTALVVASVIAVSLYKLYSRNADAYSAEVNKVKISGNLNKVLVKQSELNKLEYETVLSNKYKKENISVFVNSITNNKELETYAYCGTYYNERWIEKNFTFKNDKEPLPNVGDTLIATRPTNARSGVIEYNDNLGEWQNKDVVGAIIVGQSIKVINVYKVGGDAFIWVKFKKVAKNIPEKLRLANRKRGNKTRLEKTALGEEGQIEEQSSVTMEIPADKSTGSGTTDRADKADKAEATGTTGATKKESRTSRSKSINKNF